MRLENINEEITVMATFPKAGRPQLHSFIWERRQFKIDSVNLITRMQRGQDRIIVFAVANKLGAYKIYFNTASLKWLLAQVYWA